MKYTLPELPYGYSALEPHYSAKLLKLHHDKHHAAYVKGASTTLEKAWRSTYPGTSSTLSCERT